MKKDNVIEISEEMKIPGTDVILEAGDKIEVLKEKVTGSMLSLFQMLDSAEKTLSKEVIISLVKDTLEDYASERVIQEFSQDLNDNIGDELQYQ